MWTETPVTADVTGALARADMYAAEALVDPGGVEHDFISRLLEGEGIAATSTDDLLVRGVGGGVLSFGQERLWFLDQWRPGSASYNVPAVLRVFGGLDAVVLQRSVELLVTRHPVLRTALPSGEDGRPHVVERPSVVTPWDIEHLLNRA